MDHPLTIWRKSTGRRSFIEIEMKSGGEPGDRYHVFEKRAGEASFLASFLHRREAIDYARDLISGASARANEAK